MEGILDHGKQVGQTNGPCNQGRRCIAGDDENNEQWLQDTQSGIGRESSICPKGQQDTHLHQWQWGHVKICEPGMLRMPGICDHDPPKIA